MTLQEIVELREATKKEYGALVKEQEDTKRSFTPDEITKCKTWQNTIADLDAKIATGKAVTDYKSTKTVDTVSESNAVYNLSCERDLNVSARDIMRSYVADKFKELDDDRTQSFVNQMKLVADKIDFDFNKSRINYWMPSSEEVKDVVRSLDPGTQYKGQELIAKEYSNTLVEHMKYVFDFWNVFYVFNTDHGNEYDSPIFDFRHLEAASRATNNTAITEETSGNQQLFEKVLFKAYPYFSPYIPVTRDQITDSRFNVLQLLAKAFAFARAQALEKSIFRDASVAGTSTPQSIMYGLDYIELDTGNYLTRSKIVEAVKNIDHAYVQQPGMAIITNRSNWHDMVEELDYNGDSKWVKSLDGNVGRSVNVEGVDIPVYFTNQLNSRDTLGTDSSEPMAIVGNMKYFGLRFAKSDYIDFSEHYLWNLQQIACMSGSRFDHRWMLDADNPAIVIREKA